jgi:hypothetical protein
MRTTPKNIVDSVPRSSRVDRLRTLVRRTPFIAALAACFIASAPPAFAGSASPADANTRQAILDCTFEVLSKIDNVRVAGTAFCYGDGGELASAAHVFDQVLGSRFETPVVRDRRGRIYSIDRILRYSMRDDFVVFTIAGAPELRALPRNTTEGFEHTLQLAWRRGDGDIAFGSTQYRDRSTVASLGREGWIQFGPAPGHGASGAALFDSNGRVIGLINGRSSERADAYGFAVPIGAVEQASTEWANIAMRDPLRTLGMGSGRNLPLQGGIPLPAPYARFERHMINVRRTYFAHMVPYSLSLSGDDAPMSDAQRAELCAALEPGYCVRSNVATATRARAERLSRGCAVTWAGVGAALVRCENRAALGAAHSNNEVRAHLSTAMLGRRFAQQPAAPCSLNDPLEDTSASDTFTDHTGAMWQVRAWPVSGCDWTVLSMSRSIPGGTLTFVRGASSAYVDAASMQLRR